MQHQYYDRHNLDEIFADQTTLSGVLSPLVNVRDHFSMLTRNVIVRLCI